MSNLINNLAQRWERLVNQEMLNTEQCQYDKTRSNVELHCSIINRQITIIIVGVIIFIFIGLSSWVWDHTGPLHNCARYFI